MPKAPRWLGENALNLSVLHEDVQQLKADIGKAEFYQARILRLEYASKQHLKLIREQQQQIEDLLGDIRYAPTEAGLALQNGLTNVHADQSPLPGAEDWGAAGAPALRERYDSGDAADGEHAAADGPAEPAPHKARNRRR